MLSSKIASTLAGSIASSSAAVHHFPGHSVRLLDPCDIGGRPSPAEPREHDACTNECVGGASLTQSTRAPWSVELVAASREVPGQGARTVDSACAFEVRQGRQIERFSLHLALMSTAELVRERIEGAPLRSFIETADLPGSRRAVECELSRLVAKGDVARVRRGLYWKGPRTPVGMPLPRALRRWHGDRRPWRRTRKCVRSSFLGLTTQVPAIETIAVPGRTPTPPPGVRFVSRSIERRILGLEPTEVAVLEVLREGPTVIEAPWKDFALVVARARRDGVIRRWLITEQLGHERHVEARQRWSELR